MSENYEWNEYDEVDPSQPEVDILLIDGSILRNVWWQMDRDFYWKCKPNGEMFVCEFSVKSWKLPELPSDL